MTQDCSTVKKRMERREPYSASTKSSFFFFTVVDEPFVWDHRNDCRDEIMAPYTNFHREVLAVAE
jgi:hypothetical protein